MVYRKRKVKRKNTPEHYIQNSIINALFCNRCWVDRANSGVVETKSGSYFRGMKKGTPDLIGYRFKDNQIFFIEVKAPNGRIRPAQMAYHRDLMHRHVIHGIARSIDDALKIVNNGLVGYGYPDTKEKVWL